MLSPAVVHSWRSSSSLLQSIGGCGNDGPSLPDRRAGPLVFAQKTTEKTRKLINEDTKTLEVIILNEDVESLGKKGELLDVRAGYYRNFLFPVGKAQIVTPLLLKEMNIELERIEDEKFRVKEEAQELALVFETIGAFKVKRKGGKGKQIFGTEVDKRIVVVPEIRETGEYVAELKLHPDVTAQVMLNVCAN